MTRALATHQANEKKKLDLPASLSARGTVEQELAQVALRLFKFKSGPAGGPKLNCASSDSQSASYF